jgi:hypothetical protein
LGGRLDNGWSTCWLFSVLPHYLRIGIGFQHAFESLPDNIVIVDEENFKHDSGAENDREIAR